MRKRFTRAFYAASAAAVVTVGLATSAGPAFAGTHVQKGTVPCDSFCTNYFSENLGSSVTMNAYVPGDTGNVMDGKVGQKVNLHLYANDRPNGDFSELFDGTVEVNQLCGTTANDFFSPTSYICLEYSTDPVFEFAWSPWGVQSDLCAGVAAATPGEHVTLQTCGVGPNTMWVGDVNNASDTDCLTASTVPSPPFDPAADYCPLLNGGDTASTQPLVMTLNTGTTKPTNQLMLERETLIGGEVRSTQMWAFFDGYVI